MIGAQPSRLLLLSDVQARTLALQPPQAIYDLRVYGPFTIYHLRFTVFKLLPAKTKHEAECQSPAIVGLTKKIRAKVIELKRADGDTVIYFQIEPATEH